MLGLAWSWGCCWSEIGQWAEVGQEGLGARLTPFPAGHSAEAHVAGGAQVDQCHPSRSGTEQCRAPLVALRLLSSLLKILRGPLPPACSASPGSRKKCVI